MKEEKIITKDEYMDWLERVTLIENGIDSTTLKALPQLLIVNKDNPFALIYDRVDEFEERAHRERDKDIGVLGVSFIQSEPTVYVVVDLVIEHEAEYCDRSEDDEENKAYRKRLAALF